MMRALLGLAALVFAAAGGARTGHELRAGASGYDRPGGDYAVPRYRAAIRRCAPAAASAKRTAAPGAFPIPRRRAPRDVLSQARGGAADAVGLLRLGRARRRRDRAAGGAIEYSIDRYRRRLQIVRRRRRIPRGKLGAAACQGEKRCRPGPIAGRVTARPRRIVSSRKRSSRRGAGRAAFPAWCDSAISIEPR